MGCCTMKDLLISFGVGLIGVVMLIAGVYLIGYVTPTLADLRAALSILGYITAIALMFSGALIALSSFTSGVQFWKEDHRHDRTET